MFLSFISNSYAEDQTAQQLANQIQEHWETQSEVPGVSHWLRYWNKEGRSLFLREYQNTILEDEELEGLTVSQAAKDFIDTIGRIEVLVKDGIYRKNNETGEKLVALHLHLFKISNDVRRLQEFRKIAIIGQVDPLPEGADFSEEQIESMMRIRDRIFDVKTRDTLLFLAVVVSSGLSLEVVVQTAVILPFFVVSALSRIQINSPQFRGRQRIRGAQFRSLGEDFKRSLSELECPQFFSDLVIKSTF
ncbi:MAG: hypothetical protein CL678_03225 [Bdellovibrionaceae bacterium]|nr:hypothetical protein [Pseudobdellovibrionaceae bacterium]